MVDPFLNAALHLDFLKPVDVVGSGSGIRRTGDEVVDLLLRVVITYLYIVDFHPIDELRMIYDIFFEASPVSST